MLPTCPVSPYFCLCHTSEACIFSERDGIGSSVPPPFIPSGSLSGRNALQSLLKEYALSFFAVTATVIPLTEFHFGHFSRALGAECCAALRVLSYQNAIHAALPPQHPGTARSLQSPDPESFGQKTISPSQSWGNLFLFLIPSVHFLFQFDGVLQA